MFAYNVFCWEKKKKHNNEAQPFLAFFFFFLFLSQVVHIQRKANFKYTI